MSLFCPKCGSLLLPKKIDNEPRMSCKCGYISSEKVTKLTEKISGKTNIEIVEKKEETLPKTTTECGKCGNNEAYYWLVQTRAGDEPETKFLKCTKCDHTWRDYS
ncbi:transcription factor S [Candidatus Woesearchaeota archaeon]|nr:transcription factor S [Candidatus Woesearchaeota archaeon]